MSSILDTTKACNGQTIRERLKVAARAWFREAIRQNVEKARRGC